MMEREEKKKRQSDDEEETSSEANESDSEPEMDVPRRRRSPKQTEPVIETHNLNRTNNKGPVASDGTLVVELSGRQKRELEEQRAKEAYFQKTLEGKTPEAKATLERLARIRAQREEAAKRRKEEEAAKAALEERIREQARLKNEAAKKGKK